MFTDAEKNETAEEIAQTLETVAAFQEFAMAVNNADLQMLTQEDWTSIQSACAVGWTIAETLKQTMILGSQLIDNDAAISHIQASVSI